MEVDEVDVISFLKDVFKKELDPGSLTVRTLRERYCKDRKIHLEFTNKQRKMFSKVVDTMFNEFAEAQEAARAVNLPVPKTVVAKRSYARSSSEDDFRPTKRPKKSPEAQIELFEDDFRPTKSSEKPSKVRAEFSEDEFQPMKLMKISSDASIKLFNEEFQPRKVTANFTNHDNLKAGLGKTDTFVRVISESKVWPTVVMVKGLYKMPTLKNAKTSSDEAVLGINTDSQNEASTDELPQSKLSKLELNSSPNSSSEKSMKHGAGKSDGDKETSSSYDKESGSESTKNSKLKSKSSSADESLRSNASHKKSESHSDVQTSSNDEVLQSKSARTINSSVPDDTCSSDEVVVLAMPDPFSSDDEFKSGITAAKKKYAKIVSDAEEELPKDCKRKVKGKKDRKKMKNDHTAAKKAKHVKKRSKSDKIKAKKKLKKKNSRKANGVDEEPLSTLMETDKEKPNKTVNKHRKKGESNAGRADDEAQDSDSGAFKKKKKVKENTKAAKTSKKEKGDSESKESKKKRTPLVSNPELTLLKRYIREAGIRVMYAKIFKDCESMKSKRKALASVLAGAGIKGQPTIAKCRKLRVQKETMEEVCELDPGNILGNVEGRTRRAACGIFSTSPPSPSVVKPAKQDNSSDSSSKKAFKTLKGIVDSEDSSSSE